MKATTKFGDLVEIPNCEIDVPGARTITFKVMPDIGDTKQAKYSDGGGAPIGRASPMTVYDSSDTRKISIEMHFVAVKENDIEDNLTSLRTIMSLTYPNDGAQGVPYRPPTICFLKCGKLLGDNGVCAILENYNVKYPTDVPIDRDTLLPYKFDVSTSWQVVYASSKLPGASRILSEGS